MKDSSYHRCSATSIILLQPPPSQPCPAMFQTSQILFPFGNGRLLDRPGLILEIWAWSSMAQCQYLELSLACDQTKMTWKAVGLAAEGEGLVGWKLQASNLPWNHTSGSADLLSLLFAARILDCRIDLQAELSEGCPRR